MKCLRHYFITFFCICFLLISLVDLIPKANAASAMSASEACIEFIKKAEVFSAKPYYDYKQHTVGYGTKCPTEKYFDYMVNGISKTEADLLLRETIAEIEQSIHLKLIDKYSLSCTQHQFDALVSFSFNIGTGWMTYDSALRNALLGNGSENDFVYAFTLYCTAGGNYSSGLINRRLCEANIFLNGIYSQTPNNAYGYVFYEPNSGSLTYQVQGFVCDSSCTPAADAVRTGDVFLGWYTDLTGGTKVTELNSNYSGKTLFARWQSAETSENPDSLSTLIRVTGDVVNIRVGPGTHYGIARQVYRGDSLLLSHVAQLSGRIWGKVQNGWICLEYTNYEELIQGAGNANTGNQDVSDSDGASDDQHSDTTSHPDNSQENPLPLSGTVRVNDLLRIRSGPGTTFGKVGYLFNGNKVEILEKTLIGDTIWGRISRGWISMDYIVTEEPSSDRIDPSEMEPAQKLPVSDSQVEPTGIKGRIIADALRIRSGPGTENPIVGFYYYNDTVLVLEKTQVDSVNWGKTDIGWINLNYLRVDDTVTEHSPIYSKYGEMTVIADCLRVRKQIGTDSRIAALLYYGDTVTVFETQTVDGILWGKMEQGWICMDYVN